ncbi:MAG: ferredoxin [Deltaproteobacteria bacterium]|nr:ferredoxin [Deltaproteobacteria bacterium]
MANAPHTVTGIPTQCIGCVACSKACPVKALRVRGGVVQCDSDLCIDCGACIYVCANGARRARTTPASDLSKYKHTVAMPSMTLYGQFGKDVTPAQVLHALTQVGFDQAFDFSYVCDMVTAATEAYLSECRGPWPKISITCPAVVRLIQIRYPDLVPNLVPIEIPRELGARIMRKKVSVELGLKPEEIGIFFITPCSAIMRSINDPVGQEASYIDGAFSILELYGPLLKALKSTAHDVTYEEGISPSGLAWAMAGGETRAMRNSNTLVVKGTHDVTRVFDRIESGKFQTVDYLEAYICPDGCVSGQLVAEGRYAAQRNLLHISKRLRRQPHLNEEKVRSLLRERFFDLEGQIKAREVRPLARDLRQAIALKREKAKILERLPGKNCAACGAPTCDTLAEDVVRGEAHIEDCVFIKIELLQQRIEAGKGGTP